MDFLKIATQRDEYLTSLNAIKGNQFGKIVYSAQASVQAVLKLFEIDENVQRELNSERVGRIVTYIIEGLKNPERSFYFPPLIFSARQNGKYDKKELKYKLKSDHRMIVLDGQHRLRALERAIKYLKMNDDILYKELIDYPLSLQIYSKLTIEQEQQLFSDINSKATRVSANLIKMYSKHDETSQLMREIIYNHPSIKSTEFETRKNQTRTKLMIALTLYKIIAMLDSGKYISNQQQYSFQDSNKERLRRQTINFLEYIIKYAPYNAKDRANSIYLNQSVLLGIANVAFELPEEEWENCLFKNIIHSYDWSQNNRELEKYGVPYNEEKRRYRLTPPSRVYKSVYQIISLKLKGVKKL